MRSLRPLMLLLAVPLALGACGGSDGDDDAAEPGTTDAAGESGDDATDTSIDPDTVFLTSGDFEVVCQGAKVAAAAPYTPGDLSPMITFEGEDPDYEYRSLSFPDQWAPAIGSEATTELVLCLNRTTATTKEICTGYESDDSPAKDVELFDVTYEARLLEAQTGVEVAATEVTVSDEECPMFVMFSSDDPDPKPYYPDPVDELVGFLTEHVDP